MIVKKTEKKKIPSVLLRIQGCKKQQQKKKGNPEHFFLFSEQAHENRRTG